MRTASDWLFLLAAVVALGGLIAALVLALRRSTRRLEELGRQAAHSALPQQELELARHRPGHQQHVGMARAGDELDAQPLDVVVRVVERVDFQLAAIAGAGIDLPDGQGLAQNAQQIQMDVLHLLLEYSLFLLLLLRLDRA